MRLHQFLGVAQASSRAVSPHKELILGGSCPDPSYTLNPDSCKCYKVKLPSFFIPLVKMAPETVKRLIKTAPLMIPEKKRAVVQKIILWTFFSVLSRKRHKLQRLVQSLRQ